MVYQEIRIYNSQERKLDARKISGYFIGYSEKSKGYMFYCPNHSMRIFETGNPRLIENGEISGSAVPREVEIKEVRVQFLSFSYNSPHDDLISLISFHVLVTFQTK